VLGRRKGTRKLKKRDAEERSTTGAEKLHGQKQRPTLFPETLFGANTTTGSKKVKGAEEERVNQGQQALKEIDGIKVHAGLRGGEIHEHKKGGPTRATFKRLRSTWTRGKKSPEKRTRPRKNQGQESSKPPGFLQHQGYGSLHSDS